MQKLDKNDIIPKIAAWKYSICLINTFQQTWLLKTESVDV